jgi:hypothetical protein
MAKGCPALGQNIILCYAPMVWALLPDAVVCLALAFPVPSPAVDRMEAQVRRLPAGEESLTRERRRAGSSQNGYAGRRRSARVVPDDGPRPKGRNLYRTVLVGHYFISRSMQRNPLRADTKFPVINLQSC